MQINVMPDLALVIFASTHSSGYWRRHTVPNGTIFKAEGYLNGSKSIRVTFSVNAPASLDIDKCKARLEVYDIALGTETAIEDDCLFGRWQYRDYIISIPLNLPRWLAEERKAAG
jgi:hypothetical protein